LLNTLLGTLSSGVAASTSSYESIASATGTGSSATITFSSIPGTYKHLQIRGIYRDTRTVNTIDVPICLRFNSDSGANYISHELTGNGSSASAASSGTGDDKINIYNAGVTDGTAANIVGASIIDIHDYASTTKNKTVRGFAGGDANTASTDFKVSLSSGLWINTAAITSITVFSTAANLTTSTVFSLYGIKG
jgi:hypothetical protein